MRKHLARHLDNYLYLNKNERNGVIALLIFSFCFLSFPHVYEFFRNKEQTDFSQFLSQIEIHRFNNPRNDMYSQTPPSPVLKTIDSRASLFHFDPNSASQEDLTRLGLRERTIKTIVNYRQAGGYFYQASDMKKLYNFSDEEFNRIKNFIEKILLENGIPQKQVNMIIKYRNKGGKFYKKEDLKKIYGMPESVYNALENFVIIESNFSKKKTIAKASLQKPFVKKSFVPIQIDINKSNAEEWQKLHGIGPAFSKRITKFRDALGGFYTVDQVGETYGLPDSTFQSIKTQLVKSPILKKININQASEDDLKKHPYISWKQAKLIISYRAMHGDFKLVEDLLQIQVLNQEWLDKVKYYLTK